LPVSRYRYRLSPLQVTEDVGRTTCLILPLFAACDAKAHCGLRDFTICITAGYRTGVAP
jgi:hypothetical protein